MNEGHSPIHSAQRDFFAAALPNKEGVFLIIRWQQRTTFIQLFVFTTVVLYFLF